MWDCGLAPCGSSVSLSLIMGDAIGTYAKHLDRGFSLNVCHKLILKVLTKAGRTETKSKVGLYSSMNFHAAFSACVLLAVYRAKASTFGPCSSTNLMIVSFQLALIKQDIHDGG